MLALVVAHGALAATPQTTTVEFFNTGLQHYFVTADAVEALAVDSGAAGPGWVRTGRAFGVWTDAGAAPAGAVPVCRFYSAGSNSHFYTASAAECTQLRALQGSQSPAAAVARKAFTGWAYEGNAFLALVPAAGQCGAGTEPVNRFYNAGIDTGTGSSHRFVSDSDMAAMMQSRGWIAEGVAFCSPVTASGTSAPAVATTGSFPELAATWTGNAHWDFEARPSGPEGESAAPVSLTIATDGTLTGSGAGCAITGSIATGDGFHSLYTGTVTTAGCTDAHFIGTFPLRLERLGAAMLGMQFGSSTASLKVEVESLLSSATPPPPPPTPTTTSGPTTYVGNVAWIVSQRTGTADGATVKAANLPLTLTLDGTTLTGSGNGCAFTGTLQSAGGEDMTASVTATGCADAAFDGTYDHVELNREDGAALEVEFDKQSQSGQTTTHALIRGGLVVQGASGGTPPPTPPAQTPIVGDWSGDAHWRAVQQQGDSQTTLAMETKPLSLTIASGGALTGSGFGCSFTGTLAQAEHALTGAVTATGCTNTAFNGTYASVELEVEDGGALAVAMKFDAAGGVRVSIVGVLDAGSGGTTPPPPPPPPSAFVLAGTWSATNAEWQDSHRENGATTETESSHALTLVIAADGSLTGSGFGCAFTGSLQPVMGSTTAFTGSLSASGCTNADFNGAYDLFGAHRSDEGRLEVGMGRASVSTTLTVRVSIEAEMTKQ
jgi:hypothetical protein